MSAASASAVGLLTELVRHGIELQAHGDLLRYRPRSAMTPELAARVGARKPELLAILRLGAPPESPQGCQNSRTAAAAPPPGRVGRPSAAAGGSRPEAPHELSLAERIEYGYVNPGWTAQAWASRLRQLADRCEAIRPEVAAQYRTWAANVLENEKGLA